MLLLVITYWGSNVIMLLYIFLQYFCDVAQRFNKCYLDSHLQPRCNICSTFGNNIAATLLQNYSTDWDRSD